MVDPGRFPWTDTAWPGAPLRGQVIYEMHAGTFTREGTWQAARAELPELARLGIRAMLAGTMANLMSASIAGMLL